MKQIMVHCVQAVKSKLQCRLGYFDMFGFDFLIDEDMKVKFFIRFHFLLVLRSFDTS
jgi:hypothetical protein